MGAVPGRPATGESEGPWPADGDQPHGHWSHSAGLLLWYNVMSLCDFVPRLFLVRKEEMSLGMRLGIPAVP